MCGFVGFIDFSKKSTKDILVKMSDAIQHRGPDAGEYFLEENEDYTIGLGHRRLSIIDLHEHSNQPMIYKDWIIVYNGEVYNYQEIKMKLKALGHAFKTTSDTEVILHAFDEWGEESVKKFIGMFSFLLYNKSTAAVYTVRDRAGVKPLHVYRNDDIIMWASEIKSFHQHPSFLKKLNLDSVKVYLQLGYVPSPNSIFHNVTKQNPGTICNFRINNKTSKEYKYWNVLDYYSLPILDISYSEAKEEIKKILISACNYRMVADVPIGIFLSGGYDSTLVTAVLQSQSTQKLKTFTIGVNDKDLNEATFAKEIAQRLGTDHHELYISEDELFKLLEDVPYYYDEPFGDPSVIPTMLVSKMAKKEVDVALSADGGDEVFGGYNRYDNISKLELIRKVKKIPFSEILLPHFIKDPLQKYRLKDLINDPSSLNLSRQLNNPYYPNEIDCLLKNHSNNNSMITEQGNDIIIDDDLRAMMAFDYQNYLLNDIMVKVDRATMSASLEGREPLLDHRLIELAAQLPNTYKIKKGNKKFILKNIVHEYIPKEIMERPKMGFAPPLNQWLKNELSSSLNYYLSEEFVKKQNIFNYKDLQAIRSNFLKDEKYSNKLWYILIFQMWYERWMI